MIQEIILQRQENGMWIAIFEIEGKKFVAPVTTPVTISLLDAQELDQQDRS